MSSRPLFLPLGKYRRGVDPRRIAAGERRRGVFVVPFARVSTDRRFSAGFKAEVLKAFVASRHVVEYGGASCVLLRVRERAGILYAVLKIRNAE